MRICITNAVTRSTKKETTKRAVRKLRTHYYMLFGPPPPPPRVHVIPTIIGNNNFIRDLSLPPPLPLCACVINYHKITLCTLLTIHHRLYTYLTYQQSTIYWENVYNMK